MKQYLFGVAILLVLAVALLLVETHRTWGLLILLLAIIFYGLFANPMKEVHADLVAHRKKDAPSRKKRGKNTK